MTPQELKERRAKLNYSREKLAEVLGVSGKTVQAWEYEVNPIPLWLPLAMVAIEYVERSKRKPRP